jgi:hypothetical protein
MCAPNQISVTAHECADFAALFAMVISKDCSRIDLRCGASTQRNEICGMGEKSGSSGVVALIN